ncbi:phosphopantetheine-binding protein [Streptomyces sp. NPDC086091]|uniref:phosphopantetheine-binding protein n=1 Tax=Streptomyces sp. NPDC086091 TaxID=3365751 RepID=UPI003822A01C
MTVDITTQEAQEIAGKIALVFQEVLGATEVPDTGSGFLEIGGDSLTAARAVSLISTRLGVRITVRDLFRERNADSLALVALRRLTA